MGKEWNQHTKKFEIYDLTKEAGEVLKKTDEQFLKELKSTWKKQSQDSKTGDGADAKPTARQVKEKGLYDRLGVESNATSKQIRKAYYKMAKKTHPDVNQNDPEANEKFKSVGYAY